MTRENFDVASELLNKIERSNDLLDLFSNYAEANGLYII